MAPNTEKTARKQQRKKRDRQKTRAAHLRFVAQILDDAKAAGADETTCHLVQRLADGDKRAAEELGRRQLTLTPPLIAALSLGLLRREVADLTQRLLASLSYDQVVASVKEYTLPGTVESLALLTAWKRSGQWRPPRGAIDVARAKVRSWAVSRSSRVAMPGLRRLMLALGERRVGGGTPGRVVVDLRFSADRASCRVTVRHGRLPRFTVSEGGRQLQVFDPGTPGDIALCIVGSLERQGAAEQQIRVNGVRLEDFLDQYMVDQPIESPDSDAAGPVIVRSGAASALDPVFGSPSSGPSLDRWLKTLPQNRPGAVSSSASRDFSGWARQDRLALDDAPRLLAAFASRCLTSGPGGAIARSIAGSQPVVLAAPLVADLLESEDVPEEWLADIRVPFPVETILFSAWFEFPSSLASAIPEPHEDESPDVLAYRRPMADLRCGAAWVGVTVAAALNDRLHANVIMLMASRNEARLCDLVPIPAHLPSSQMKPLVERLAAYVATLRPRQVLPRSRRRPSGGPRTALRPSAGVSVVTIQSQTVAHPLEESARHKTLRRSHTRRGHWRRVRCGPRMHWHYELRWIPPTVVGPGQMDDQGRIYAVPERF